VAGIYVVVVESNLVAEIRRSTRDPASPPLPTSLEVGTALAERFRTFGCIDGTYTFENASGARVFSLLCLQFTKAIAERRLLAVEALPPAFESYLPQDGPRSGRVG
jgi:hypothetical protein